MKRILFASALALVALPTAAFADEGFLKAGEIEVGGLLGIISETETYKPEGGEEEKSTLTGVAIQPEVAYFVMDGLGLIGRLDVLSFSQKVEDADPTTQTRIGLGAGAGYYLPLGAGLRLGPQVILKFNQTTTTVPDFAPGEDLEIAETGTGAEVGAFAKVAIGHGGIIAAGIALDYASISQNIELGSIEIKPTGAATNIGARVGYFVSF